MFTGRIYLKNDLNDLQRVSTNRTDLDRYTWLAFVFGRNVLVEQVVMELQQLPKHPRDRSSYTFL